MRSYAGARLIVLVMALLSLGFGLGTWAQTGDYFQNYPGGLTAATYQITTADLANPIVLTWRVEPGPGDQLRVTTTNRVLAPREALSSGVVSGVSQVQLVVQDEAVRTLLENAGSLRSQASFVLPGGARFRSAARETVQGVRVICGMLTDPDEPNERTFLGIANDPALPFPPFVQREEARPSGGEASNFPVCSSLASLTQGSEGRFAVTFRMELTTLNRRP